MMRRAWMTVLSGAVGVMTLWAFCGPASAAPNRSLSAISVRELSPLYRATMPGARRRAPSARTSIIGGTSVPQGTLRSAAFVVYFDPDGNPQRVCSGTVISANVVLTAAHCVVDDATLDPLAATGFRVFTGASDWTNETIRTVSAVSQVIPQPNYDDVTDTADAALLVLTQPTTATAVRLASDSERYLYTAGMPAAIAGWGIDESGSLSTVLRAADTTVQGAGYCSEIAWFFDNYWQTCAVQAPGFASGVCAGDSGGPLLALDVNDRLVEIGVIDIGPKDCTDTTHPGYFARAHRLLPWASSIVASVAPPGSPRIPPPPNQPVPPTLTIQNARSYAAAIIRKRTHTRPRLIVSCLRLDAWKLRCDLSWRSGSSTYQASGMFWHVLTAGRASWRYDVTGQITRRNCSHARCRTIRQRFRWR